MSELTVIVPAYNEAESLLVLLPELIGICEKNGYSLVVVDDGSTDESSQVLGQFENTPCLKVVSHKLNRGYGGAIKSGIRRAESRYIITLDADGQHDANDVVALHRELIETDADMIVGGRPDHADASAYRSLGKKLIRWFAGLLLAIPIRDLNSGIKMYDAILAKKYISLCPDSMAFSDIITLIFISEKRRVLERPVNIKPRLFGVSTVRTQTAVETVREIINLVILFNPMRVFFPIAALFIILSLIWGVPIVLSGRGVSTGALLGFFTGLIFLLLGLLAEQLALIRKSGIGN